MEETLLRSSMRTECAFDILNLVANVASTVGIVMVNKLVMTSLPYPMALTLAHQIVCTILISARMCRCRPEQKLPARVTWWLGGLVLGGIYAQNLSLRINPVTFYQIAKLMNIPAQCLYQYFTQSKVFSIYVYASLVALTCGIGLSTVAELNIEVTVAGLTVAVLAVFIVVLEQAEIARISKKYQMSSMELLLSLGPHRIFLAAVVVMANERGIFEDMKKVELATWGWVILSCVLATSVNITVTKIIGKFGPVTTAVVGHAKTMSIIGLGFFLRPPVFDMVLAKNLTGISIALIATVKYGQYTAFPEADCCARCRPKMLTIEDGEDEKCVNQKQVSPFSWDALYSMKKVLPLLVTLMIFCGVSVPIVTGLPATMIRL
mmetsp:Transcript_65395/g.123797  ORF Transcript_65395/g.123797 Transcript_65395/m.123797 type:complete len:377 (-) Transcript_65395:155-1285(-)